MTSRIYNRQCFKTGQVIFRADDPAHCAYLVQSGHVEIVTGEASDRQVIATIGPGEIFGEMALLESGTRSASAIAREPVTCVVVSEPEFAKYLASANPLMRTVLKLLSQRLRKAIQKKAA